MIISEGITFDDILLKPKYSTVKSRSGVDLSVKIGDLNFSHPLIPANMATITGKEMANAAIKSGGLAILHRFMPIEEQISISKNIIESDDKNSKHLAISIGVKDNDKEYVKSFYNVGVRIVCIDIAHGDSEVCVNMIVWIKSNFPDITVIAGNVATGNGARRLWLSGADIVKVGVGPGSLCTTRIETGNGVPQMTAIMEVAQVKTELEDSYYKVNRTHKKYVFIADGGIKNAGDCVKSLVFADMVMVGNLFAGLDETPGEVFLIDGIQHKTYVGSSTHKANRIEGVAAFVPCKGKFKDILSKLLEGIQSGCSYQGSENLTELKIDPQFVKITNAGLKESHPHDVRLQ